MKKFWAILLAVMLVLSMTVVAGAEATGDTEPVAAVNKITAPDNGHTYEILQIFTGDLHNGTLANLAWGVNGKVDGTTTKVGDLVSETIINELKGKTGDEAVRDYIVNTLLSSAEPFATIGKVDEGFVATKEVPAGYYMIRDKAGTLTGTDDSYTLYIVKVTGDVTIAPKADKPSLVKKIKDTNDSEGTTSDWQDSADYDIGDEVPYRLTATVANNFQSYKGAYKLVFHDTMEAGLTFNEGSVKVFVNDTQITAGYTVTGIDDHNFTVTLDDLKNVEYGTEGAKVAVGDKIHVEFTATLNKNAVIGAKGNLNTAYLEFANNPNSEQPEMGETPEDTVIAFTYQVVINKVHKVGGEFAPLTGAQFTLEKKIGSTTWKTVDIVEVNEAGTVFTFKGLDDGTYRLTETVVPSGYNKMADVIFTVTADHKIEMPELNESTRYDVLKSLNGTAENGVITLNVTKKTEKVDGMDKELIEGLDTIIENKSGAQLPETGGIGTTIFYVLGGMMFVGAALILIVRRKAEADEN